MKINSLLCSDCQKNLKLEQSLYAILQILSVTLFEKMPILLALSNIDYKEQEAYISNKLNLFN